MAILHITQDDLNEVKRLGNQGTTEGISEAWAFLGRSGDAYGFLAAAILSSDTASMPLPARVFYEMVRIQWENTVGPGLWGTQKFIEVGQKHLNNYLELIQRTFFNDTVILPTTIQIEASYKNALQDNLLPPITAIDSLFSVLDTYFGNAIDRSWAEFMDWLGNWPMGGPRWEVDRIEFNSDVFLDSVTPFDAALTLARVMFNAAEAVPGGGAVALEVLAPAYWGLKLMDGTLDFNITDFANHTAVTALLLELDPKLKTADIARVTDGLLDAIDTNNRQGFDRLVDQLGKVFDLNLPPSNTTRVQFFDNLKALALAAKPLGPLTVESLVGKPSDSIAAKATDDNVDALAYRYALKELNPFAILGVDYNGHNAAGALDLYDVNTGQGALTTEWVIDRSYLLSQLIVRNTADSIVVVGSSHNETYVDLDQNLAFSTADVTHIGPGLPPDSKRYIFGSDGGDSGIEGGTQGDRLYGMGGDDTLKGNDGNDYLEGNRGNDILAGGDGHDTLDGGRGDDTLVGGTGNDKLYGGGGLDVYVFEEGVNHGNDLIQDAVGDGHGGDGLGAIVFWFADGRKVTLGEAGPLGPSPDRQKGECSDGLFIYQFTGRADADTGLPVGRGDLVITRIGATDRTDQIVLKDFQNGAFGITLQPAPYPGPRKPHRRTLGPARKARYARPAPRACSAPSRIVRSFT